ncbi:MAG: hypothetical protein GYA24_05790 [Candidatus Lokiarchaeota archaeon]|nr:hypothetical protein [Candidatus Lokiarchaeota archaeon]
MASNMNKVIAVLAGVVGIIAIIPVEVLSWWKADIDPILGNSFSHYIDAFAQYYTENAFNSVVAKSKLDDLYLGVGIAVIAGAAILVLAGIKASKAAALLGSILLLAGPIMFLIAHNGNDDLSTYASWFGSENVFFGSYDGSLGKIAWYLNLGFFLPIIGALIGFLSMKSNK